MTALRVLGEGDPALAPAPDLAAARAHVVAARPGEPSHEANRARTLAFVDAHPDALFRTCAAGHLTGSAMVVDPARRAFLLLLHAKLGLWLQPGGHADGDGNLPGVAWREATEETGIAGLRVVAPAVDLDVHAVPGAAGPAAAPPDPSREDGHLHLDARYLVLAPPGARPAPNHESLDMRWVPAAELAAFGVDEGTVRMGRAALAAVDELASTGRL